MASSATEKKQTESSMYRLLHERLCKDSGNGPQAVLVPGVRSAAGFDARRTIDAISLGLWPSRGMLLDAYEIKVSRSDWQRELKAPAKAEEFVKLVDRFWVVVSDKDIVRDGELPEKWGLLVRRGTKLHQAVAAKPLHDDARVLPPGFSRTFLVPLLRAANQVSGETLADIRAEARKAAESGRSFELKRAQEDLEKLRENVAAFEEGAGIKITERFWSTEPDEVKRRGAAFAACLDGDKKLTELGRLAGVIESQAERLLTTARDVVPEIANAASESEGGE